MPLGEVEEAACDILILHLAFNALVAEATKYYRLTAVFSSLKYAYSS